MQVLQQKLAYLHFESYIQLRELHVSVVHLLLLRDTFAIIVLYTSCTYFVTVCRDSISCMSFVTVLH